MNARVQNHVTGRLSLRPPQAESLARLKQALDASPEMLEHDEINESKQLADYMRFEVKA